MSHSRYQKVEVMISSQTCLVTHCIKSHYVFLNYVVVQKVVSTGNKESLPGRVDTVYEPSVASLPFRPLGMY